MRRLEDVLDWDITRGEINQTIYRKFITSDRTKARMIKGVEIGPYVIHETLSQGEREWIDEKRLVTERGPRRVASLRRIATQRITGIDELNRPEFHGDLGLLGDRAADERKRL